MPLAAPPSSVGWACHAIVFVTFGVIFVTLVGQGLTLPTLIRRLGVRDDGTQEQEEMRARLGATDAALARLEELAGAGGSATTRSSGCGACTSSDAGV